MNNSGFRFFPRVLSVFGLVGLMTVASTTQAAAERDDSSEAAESDAESLAATGEASALWCGFHPRCFVWRRGGR